MLQNHEGDGAGTAIMDDVLARACILSGDTLTRLIVILGGLELDTDRMRRNLELTDGLVSSEAVMLALGRVIGRQHAHDVVSEAANAVGRDGRRFVDALAADSRVTAHLDATAIAALHDPSHHTGRSSEIAHDAASRARALATRLRDVDG